MLKVPNKAQKMVDLKPGHKVDSKCLVFVCVCFFFL